MHFTFNLVVKKPADRPVFEVYSRDNWIYNTADVIHVKQCEALFLFFFSFSRLMDREKSLVKKEWIVMSHNRELCCD